MSTSISLLNNDFSAQDQTNSKKIAVYWNGRSLVDESAPGATPKAGGDFPYGPVPLVDISRSYNVENGSTSFVTTTIDLTGKIVSLKNKVVFDDVMKKATKLEKLFKGCVFGSFAIMCGTAVAYTGDNFYVKQIQFSKTDNNWTRFLDYTISLESKAPVTGLLNAGNAGSAGANQLANYVESRNDVWTIEQLQDYTFSKFTDTINPEILSLENNGADGKGKNNYVKPDPGGAAVGGGSIGGGAGIDLMSVPQFKISRRLSAKGLPFSGALPVACTTNGLDQINRIRFLNAKAWVNMESDKIMDNTPANHSGSIRLAERSSDSIPFAITGTWLYNHLRTTNADIYNGTYEINDTWLAMPTGIGYTETFTLDSSTNANGIKSVRVAGAIQGLYIHKIAQTDDTHHIISGTLPPYGTTVPQLRANISGSINDTTKLAAAHKLPSSLNDNSTVRHIEENKYRNALSGWLQEVKPYLYRRACIGHQRSVTPGFQVNRFKPLRTIPISTTEGHDPLKGIITYNYEYNNQFRAISGVLSENINIVDDAPTNNIIETPVMGRELGPIIQSLGANNPRRTVTIDIVVQPPSGINAMLRTNNKCPLYVSGSIYGAVQTIINGNKPFDSRTGPIWTNYSRTSPIEGNVFTQSDDETWEPTQGRYSRTITWIYKQCNSATDFMST
jgi:hypothetical protein